MDYDYIIIGSGGAGLYTALKAQKYGRVLIITKGALGGGSTPLAQGGIAAAIGPEDSDELHQSDTLLAGKGLCDPNAVAVLVTDAAECIDDLIRLGVPFDYEGSRIALGLEGAHSVPRVVHAGGDATGLMLQQALAHDIEYLDRIAVLDEHLVTDLVVEDGVCRAVRTCDLRDGSRQEFAAHFVVLATGGFGQLFAHTTNSPGATGDGIAIALRAGADVVDMEFVQFHPTVLCTPDEHQFLISEAVRGEGAILRDTGGRRFMKDYDARGELAPRDVVSRAILTEMERSGEHCVYLDITHLPASRTKARFPSIYSHCVKLGIDMATCYVPVAPAAHYSIGGVKTNLWGETTVANLFACGEVACTGVHGANRLASNSLLELLVFGRRVVRRTVELAAVAGKQVSSRASSATAHNSGEVEGASAAANDFSIEIDLGESLPDKPLRSTLEELQQLCWDKLGVTRNGASMEVARQTLSDWHASLDWTAMTTLAERELANLVLVGRLAAEAATARLESRGTHYRVDYPGESPAWLRHIVLRRKPQL